MPRNAEVIRQWNILREIESSRRATISSLAEMTGVSSRTIRRDLEALQEAGFPLFDEKEDGRTWWKLGGDAFKGMTTGFTLSELCALYFSRQLLEGLAGAPFQADLRRAFAKFEHVLGPRMRTFLDRMPGVIGVKAGLAARTPNASTADLVARLLDATFNQREVAMEYHSLSSERTKEYRVHPYRVIYAEGGLYLLAYVPEYSETRTFAAERIRRLTVLEDRFEKNRDAASEVFASSLGVHTGPTARVRIEFAPKIAPYIQARVWHGSQRLRTEPDGSVVMDLEVCVDRALRTWILSFGPLARVIAPESLANEIAQDLEAARGRYSGVKP